MLQMLPGGWWHNYVCPTHHVELEAASDVGYPCRYGCVLTGEPYASAWITLQHQATARRIRRLAHDDPEQALDMLRAYVDLYADLADSGWSEKSLPWMLKGKLFAQALSEAIWATQVADAVHTLGSRAADPGVAKLLESVLDTMAGARRILVDDRDDLRNNYTAWLDAAGSLVSIALGEIGRLADADTWRQYMFEHIRVAVGDDGWEWEGSTYYHLFVLRAYLLNLRGCAPGELPVDVGERLVGMLQAVTSIATPGGALPMLSDGPYRRAGVFQEIAEVCAIGRQLCAVPGLDRIESYARATLALFSRDHRVLATAECCQNPVITGEERGSDLDDLPTEIVSGWFNGPPLPAPDEHGPITAHREVGIVVLRDPSRTWQAVVDAGVEPERHGSHRHASQLSLYLYGTDEAWQPAPGVPPYVSRLRREYYPKAAAHPTVVIDRTDQDPFAAEIAVGAKRVVLSAPLMRRELVMASDYLLDVVTVDADAEHDVSLGLRPSGDLEARGVAPQAWRTRWTSGSRPLHGLHISDQATALDVRPAHGTSDDPTRLVTAADWTFHGAAVTFVSVYRPSDSVADVDLDGRAVSVTIDGRTDTHYLEV